MKQSNIMSAEYLEKQLPLLSLVRHQWDTPASGENFSLHYCFKNIGAQGYFQTIKQMVNDVVIVSPPEQLDIVPGQEFSVTTYIPRNLLGQFSVIVEVCYGTLDRNTNFKATIKDTFDGIDTRNRRTVIFTMREKI